MAISPIGTPVNTHSATGSVTGSWGTGQVRTAGNLLVAVVSAAAATSVTATAATAGWSKEQEIFNTAGGRVLVAIWSKIATGGDGAPTVTTTETGTAGGMDCMMFELLGANNGFPLDAYGAYSSGASAGTLSAMTATTSSNVTNGGEFAVAVFAQEAAAASLTWTDAGTGGFTKVLNGNGVSTVLQTYIGYVNAPALGAALNDAGAFSVNTSAYGAGLVYVFLPGVPGGTVLPIEGFTNNGAATVTTGGTTAPAAGTSEAWTSVNVTGAFPVASGVYQFHVCDPALPSEKILVTAAPGGVGGTQSWTVTRGAEDSPVVAHAAGFAIVQVVTAGVLAQINPQGVLSVNALGADPTGTADSTAAIQSAVTTLANAGLGGVVALGPGNYKVTGNIVLNSAAPVYIRGAGIDATQVNFAGTGDCFRIYNSSTYGIAQLGGCLTGMSIDGTLAGNGSCALHMGDIAQYQVEFYAKNFTGTGSKGAWFDNQYYWTEQMRAFVATENCVQGIVFDRSAGAAATATGSFVRGIFEFFITQSDPTFDGLVLQNGVFFGDGQCMLGGNFGRSASALTSAAVRITGSGLGVQSNIHTCRLDWGVELGGVGANSPYNIFFGTSSNFIWQSYGQMDFTSGTGTFQACNFPTSCHFAGPIRVTSPDALAGSSCFPFLYGFQQGVWFGSGAAATSLSTGGTITTTTSYLAVTSAGAVTGIILSQPPVGDGQLLILANTGSFSITMAAAGTSHVVNGVSCVIAATTAQLFVYSASAGLWYPVA